MPVIDPQYTPRPRPKPRRREIYGPPVPLPSITRSPFERPLAPQRYEARARVRSARRALPPLTLAAPPVVVEPRRAPSGDRPLTRAEIHGFLTSTSRVTQAARGQIVGSIRRQVADTRGADRVRALDRVVDEIRHDPRLRGTRRAIRYYTALEQGIARQQDPTRVLRPGPTPRKIRLGVGPLSLATINTTAGARTARNVFAAVAPGLQGDAPTRQFARNALKDVGALGAAPFIGAYQTALVGRDVVTGHPVRAGKRVYELGKGVAEQTVEDWSHPGRYFREHPGFFALDLLALETGVGRGLGAAARGLGKKGAPGWRGAAARAGSTERLPIALEDDLAGGVYHRRPYSKDVFRAMAQRARDRSREVIYDAEGRPVAVRPRQQIFRDERERLNKRTANLRAGRHIAGERLGRDIADRAFRVPGAGRALGRRIAGRLPGERVVESLPGVRGRYARDIVSLVTRGTILTGEHFEKNLEDYVKRVKAHLAEHDDQVAKTGHSTVYHDEDEVKRARDVVKAGEAVLGSPKAMAQAEQIVQAGTEAGRRLVAGEREVVERTRDVPEQMQRARLIEPAAVHMGARHYTVAEHRALERAALATEKDAAEAHRQAKTPTDRKAALDALNAAREHRIAVSGRDPVGVRSHEAAKTAHTAAGQRHTQAQHAEQSAQRRVQALVDRHKSERGREAWQGGPVAAYHVGGKRYVLFKDAVEYARAHGLNPRKDIQRVATTAAEARRVGELSQARRALRTATDRRKQAAKDLRNAELHLGRNPMPATRAALRHGPENPSGKTPGSFLPTREIEDFLRSKGRDPETVAWLPGHTQRSFFHQAFRVEQSRKTLAKPAEGTRTGALHLKGGTETSAEILRAAGIRQATILNHARHIDSFLGEHGMRHPAWGKAQRGEQLTRHEQKVVDEGGYWNSKDALTAIDRARARGQRLAAVRAYPTRLSEADQELIRSDLQNPGAMDSVADRLLNNRFLTEEELKKTSGKARNLLLVNGDMMDTMRAHLTPRGELTRWGNMLNRMFRYAVLPQPRWLTGNNVEPMLVRMPGAGSGVNVFGMAADLRAESQILAAAKRSPDPEIRAQAEQYEAHNRNGLLYGNRSVGIHTTIEDYPGLAKIYSRIVARSPAVGHMLDISGMVLGKLFRALVKPLDFIFNINSALEHVYSRAAQGRSMRRELQRMTGSWAKTAWVGREAAEQAAAGMFNTAKQFQFLRESEELLGKYGNYGPKMRRVIQTIAPFLPWMLSAVRFVYWTMPIHRSAQTAFFVRVSRLVGEEWQQEHAAVPPGSLKYAIPTKGGGWLDLARYTPWGATIPITQGDYAGVVNQFFPQIRGAAEAISGRDPFGREIRINGAPPNGWQKLGIALNQVFEATAPYVSTIRRLREHGETSQPGSNVLFPKTKPGTSHGMSAVSRTFDPFRPTYLTAGGAVNSADLPTGGGGRPANRTEALMQALSQAQAQGPAGGVSEDRLDELLRGRP